jgi:aryl-alcohol dehydrogenase-like predicted oxidoreductase
VRPIVGASRAAHLDAVEEALTVGLSDDEIRTIETGEVEPTEAAR